ncbi:hypothetical protein DFS33DRAFT_1377688 [Desarmillaria ectypa]|nr:hypothetical protein DFS33DRAFT_1377688 [Desarmillaria ectypa]
MAFLLRTSVVLALALAFVNAAPASEPSVVPMSTFTASRIEHSLVHYSPYLVDFTDTITYTQFSTSTADVASATH